LNRAAPHGLTRITVAAGGLAGATLLLDLQEEKDYWLGTYEPELQSAVAELVQPGMVAYDVGANIGYISILLARRAGEKGQAFAFEALPDNLERLRQNLALNDLGALVQVVAAAVTDRSGAAQFLVGPSGGMGKAAGSAGRQAEYKQAISVAGLALDDFVYTQGNPAPQVVKMDIEGGEVLALPGMRRLLKEAHPLMLIELHGPEAARLVWDELSHSGYRICRMGAGYPTVDSVEALDWKAYIVAK
jgi:FkbM family methyltransferase